MPSDTQSSVTRVADWGIRGATVAVFVEGLRDRNPNAVANAVLMFAATYLPDAAEQLYGVEFRPWQRAYAEGAMFAHAAGFLGPYDETWWWDHLTHILSASLLGGLFHVAARRRGRSPDRAILAGVIVGGVLWECIEYAVHWVSNRLDVEPLLVYYGLQDTIEDVLFNVVGAVLVLAFGDRLLGNFTGDAD